MRIFRNAMLLAAGALFALSAPMGAQSSGTTPQAQAASQPSKSMAKSTAKSMASANQHAADLLNTINQDEINSGKMMANHTQNDEVKEYATMLVNDHQELQKDLEKAAQSSNISLNTNDAMMQRASKDNDSIKNEAQKPGDEAFARHEARGHRNAIHQLQQLESKVTDPQIKDVVHDAIPILQKHLDEAQKLEKTLKQ